MADAKTEYQKYKTKIENGYLENSFYTGNTKLDLEKNKNAMKSRVEALDRLIVIEDNKLKEST